MDEQREKLRTAVSLYASLAGVTCVLVGVGCCIWSSNKAMSWGGSYEEKRCSQGWGKV